MKRIVIIGGGFAGTYVARSLEKEFEVILIDTKNYFEFTPGILRTIVEPAHIKKIQILHTHYLKRARVLIGQIKAVSDREVILQNKKIKFDYLAICSGSTYNFPFKEKDVVIVSRAERLRECFNKLCKARKVVIVGGGLVGVELAAEIATHYNDKKITIIHAGDKLIERNSIKAIKYAENFLNKKDVKIVYNEMVIKKDGRKVITNKGNKFEADIIFLCTGITPNFDFIKKGMPKWLTEEKFVKVNDYLQIVGNERIFAAGDITNKLEEKTAQNAKRQAKAIVHNIRALEENKNLKEYISKKTPLVISLGKYNGIFSWDKFVFTGIIPGILKTLIEKREMFFYKL